MLNISTDELTMNERSNSNFAYTQLHCAIWPTHFQILNDQRRTARYQFGRNFIQWTIFDTHDLQIRAKSQFEW